MFERGDGTKLNDEVIGKLSKKFGIGLKPAEPLSEAVMVPKPVVEAAIHSGFCPNAACPSHRSLQIEGRLILQPNRVEQDPVGGKYCAICGEVLERKCPNCGAPVHEGAICSWCGQPYVTV